MKLCLLGSLLFLLVSKFRSFEKNLHFPGNRSWSNFVSFFVNKSRRSHIIRNFKVRTIKKGFLLTSVTFSSFLVWLSLRCFNNFLNLTQALKPSKVTKLYSSSLPSFGSRYFSAFSSLTFFCVFSPCICTERIYLYTI